VLAANPDFTDARLHLARAYEATRRFGEAADAYREVIARDPALSEQVLIGLGTCYLNLHRLGDAKSHAEAARKFNPGGAGLLLARIALAANDAKAAERYARDAMNDRHYRTAATLLASEALVEQGDRAAAEKALSLLDSVKAGARPVPTLEMLRSDALLHLERVDEAIEALRTEIRQFPAERDAYGRLAAVQFLRGDNAAAAGVLEQLVRANPTRASYELAAKTLEHFGHAAEAARWRERERTAAVQ
jgi:tetratricopeptide (TPR) repeat protein